VSSVARLETFGAEMSISSQSSAGDKSCRHLARALLKSACELGRCARTRVEVRSKEVSESAEASPSGVTSRKTLAEERESACSCLRLKRNGADGGCVGGGTARQKVEASSRRMVVGSTSNMVVEQ
jgi:hypothetical protein